MCNTRVGKLNNSERIDIITALKKRFTESDQKQASCGRRYQYVGGHPSNATLKYSSVTIVVQNSPFTKQGINMIVNVIGHSDVAVQEMTTCTKLGAIIAQENLVNLYPPILKYYNKVKLIFAVMHINRIQLYISLSKKIHYSTISAFKNIKIPMMKACYEKIIYS